MPFQNVDADFDNSAYGLIDLGNASPHKSSERFLFLWVILQALAYIGMIQSTSRAEV
jgi:hypothetical protein